MLSKYCFKDKKKSWEERQLNGKETKVEMVVTTQATLLLDKTKTKIETKHFKSLESSEQQNPTTKDSKDG